MNFECFFERSSIDDQESNMLKNDALSQLKQLKRDIKASRNLHEGVVKGTSNKFGFVTLDSGKDIFLPADEMAKVLPGDHIEVEVIKEPKNKTYALVERLISSPTKEFYGKYLTKGNAHFVEADIQGLSQWMFVPPPKRKNAKAKDLVRCKLTQHPIKNGKAQAAVVEIIGAEQDDGIEMKYAMSKHGITMDWPQAVLDELVELSESDVERLSEGREDLTDIPFVTIDSSSTKDLDDALWAEANDDGWLLRVAIADPVALIKEKSALDKEALKRATAVYFPGQVVPMLPPLISSELGSLNEGKKRLARVIELVVSSEGELGSVTLRNAIVCSVSKLSYTSAEELIEGADVENVVQPVIRKLSEVAAALAKWRQENAIIQPRKPEFYIELNDRQKIAAIHPKVQTSAHSLVEECMVAANRSIALYLIEQELPGIFIRHDGVREDRREALTEVIKKQAPDSGLSDISDPIDYAKCVRKLLANEETHSLFSLWSRQLCRTELSAEAGPHFAMGLSSYTTFTSPLRKATDYMLHRQIQKHMDGKVASAIDSADLLTLDARLQASRAAVYDVDQWLKCQFMNKQTEAQEAVVTRVFAAGCQVRLVSNGIEGFLAVRELPGKFSYNQDQMILKGEAYQFHLDQVILVRKKLIDWSRKQIQFVPAEAVVVEK